MGVGMASTLRGRSSSRIRGSGLVGLPGPRPSVGGIPGPRPGGLGAIRGEFLNPGIRAGVVSPTFRADTMFSTAVMTDIRLCRPGDPPPPATALTASPRSLPRG